MKQLLTVAFFCAACAIGFAQPGTKTQLDKAINAKNPALADSLLQLRLNYFFFKKSYRFSAAVRILCGKNSITAFR